MADNLRLMAVLAHPDDESLGVGGTLAKYASEGIEVFLLTATRGESGRYRGHRDGPEHPGPEELGRIRERELRAAASVLGIRELSFLDYRDKELDRADPHVVIPKIASHLRRLRPHVVVTFGPDGAYGHPDHIAISQFTTAALVSAADPSLDPATGAPHSVSKLYYFAWPESAWSAYQAAFGRVTANVDGIQRQVVPWSDWSVTTAVDTRRFWRTAWEAISCHESQITAFEGLKRLSPEQHEAIWGTNWFYRVFSLVNAGRARESDLFEGLRGRREEEEKEHA